jgi:hypothetical protein
LHNHKNFSKRNKTNVMNLILFWTVSYKKIVVFSVMSGEFYQLFSLRLLFLFYFQAQLAWLSQDEQQEEEWKQDMMYNWQYIRLILSLFQVFSWSFEIKLFYTTFFPILSISPIHIYIAFCMLFQMSYCLYQAIHEKSQIEAKGENLYGIYWYFCWKAHIFFFFRFVFSFFLHNGL